MQTLISKMLKSTTSYFSKHLPLLCPHAIVSHHVPISTPTKPIV